MYIVYYLIGAAAFFGILAWIIERKYGNPLIPKGDAQAPISYLEQKRARIETEIASRPRQSTH